MHKEKNTSKIGPKPEIGFNGQKPKAKVKMDPCIRCGGPTIYPANMHIDYRLYYVEGAGQLCPECYEIIYSEKPRA